MRRQRHQLLGVRHELAVEDVPIGEEVGGPHERLAQRVHPLQVVGEGELEDVLALGRDRRWPV